VAGGDNITRCTCLDMLFRSFLDFGTGWIIADIYIFFILDVLLDAAFGILDSYSFLPDVILCLGPEHFAALRMFCNPSSGD
jgi:hypothetical protein